MTEFRAPLDIPQDLLLIQELIGSIEPALKLDSPDLTDVDSSDTEDEVEALLLKPDIEPLEALPISRTTTSLETVSSEVPHTSDSSSDASSSSDDDDNTDYPTISDKVNLPDDDLEDDEEGNGPVKTASSYTFTKNETAASDIVVPTVETVGDDEILELAGHITSIIGNIVIVTSGDATGRKPATLDTGTLLVFQDRRVLGHLYETFGPTSQPLYQVRFSDSFPLNLELVETCKPVYHIPARSNFVFLSQIEKIKGSDASNVHDEEVADDELEFSDDEAEAAYKSQKKRKRGDSRFGSVAASSRASTPSQMRDQELHGLGGNAYDAHGPYDIDYSESGPSIRPMPIPYDDPYSETYNTDVAARPGSPTSAKALQLESAEPLRSGGSSSAVISASSRDSVRGARGQPRGDRGDRGRARGNRGRGGGQSRGNARPRRDERASRSDFTNHPPAFRPNSWQPSQQQQHSVTSAYSPTHARASSNDYTSPNNQSMQQPYMLQQQQAWQYPQKTMPFPFNYPPSYAYTPQPPVQPHINPRFASALGFASWSQASYPDASQSPVDPQVYASDSASTSYEQRDFGRQA